MSSTAHATVGATGERALIARLRQRAGSPPDWVPVGIGDDAAVIEPGRGMVDVVTTDSLIEDVHFRRTWATPRDIGYKALAVNLSDLAAMGATPRASLLSLGLPPDLPLPEFDEIIDGFLELVATSGAPLVGGNLARSPGPLILDVTAIGMAHRRKLLTRGGGRAGDELFVTGVLGAAAAGLAMLANGPPTPLTDVERQCIERHLHPIPRLRLGASVAKSRSATACVDLSDGLADAAQHLAAASRTGVTIEGDLIPVHPGVTEWAARFSLDPHPFALAGGEDYELLFAVRPRMRSRFLAAVRRFRDVTVTRVGRLDDEDGAWEERAGTRGLLPDGFAHFGANRD